MGRIREEEFMSKYDTEALEHILETIHILLTPFALKHYLVLLIPILIVYKINIGFLFIIFIVLVCVYARSGRLGFIFAWFIGAMTVIIFYLDPDIQHFIIDFLRAGLGRSHRVVSPEHAMKVIPQTLEGKIFLASVYGAFIGLIGAGIGVFSRYIRGYHPYFDENRS
jgi:hypothetical protein